MTSVRHRVVRAVLVVLGLIACALVVGFIVLYRAYAGGECAPGGRCAASPPAPTPRRALLALRARVPADVPIYWVGRPLSGPPYAESKVPDPVGQGLYESWPEEQGLAQSPYPRSVWVQAKPPGIGHDVTLWVVTLYDGAKLTDMFPPLYSARPSRRVRVQVFDYVGPGDVRAPHPEQAKAWIRGHLTAYSE